jgi:two-component system, LytTR family, response regulator AlgR
MKLLIADDEPLARERLKSLVADINSSIKVAQASNGLEVLQQVNDFNPDIILLDIIMPEMDGIEVAQHLSNL